MIIAPSELHELEQFLEALRVWYDTPDEQKLENPRDPVFFANRPHLLLPLGFDEYRALTKEDGALDRFGVDALSIDFEYECVYRELKTGAWYWFEGMSPESIHFVGPSSAPEKQIPVSDWLRMLQKRIRAPDPQPYVLWLPSIWSPDTQLNTRLALGGHVSDLLQAIYREREPLTAVPPHRFEEIVAELLRQKGMEIFVTPRTRDGGRDIIARGETIPGEPLTIAIEVKQKQVVGIHDVQRALRANEDFPALMVATTGRFSAGVVKEKQRDRNQLRLILKDGVALSQWIDAYGKQRGWSKH